MADAAELVVRIRGDASDLEATIAVLKAIVKIGATQTKIIIRVQKVLRHIKANAGHTNCLATSRLAVTNKKRMRITSESVNKNVTALKAQKGIR
ncbi:MAG: hypothetical protein ACLS7B_09965 [Hominilimicola sp.]